MDNTCNICKLHRSTKNCPVAPKNIQYFTQYCIDSYASTGQFEQAEYEHFIGNIENCSMVSARTLLSQTKLTWTEIVTTFIRYILVVYENNLNWKTKEVLNCAVSKKYLYDKELSQDHLTFLMTLGLIEGN